MASNQWRQHIAAASEQIEQLMNEHRDLESELEKKILEQVFSDEWGHMCFFLLENHVYKESWNFAVVGSSGL